MKRIYCFFLLAAAFEANAATTQYITNRGFETGNFSGWAVTNTGSGTWNINNGTYDPSGSQTAQAPISGSFDAVTNQSGPGFHSLYQTFTLDTSFTSAIFSWSDRIWSDGGFSDPNQEWRALVKNSVGILISTVFSTNPGDVNQNGPNARSFDLTSILLGYAGQTIRVGFEEQDNQGFFAATLDNVSFTTTNGTVPEPTSLALLGLGFAGMCLARRKAI